MQKMNLILSATALLLLSALSSCTKEEMKQTKSTNVNSTETKSLAKGSNYVMYGTYIDDGWFQGCTGSNGCCMVIIRPATRWTSGGSYTMTPNIDAGDNKLQVDKYKARGVETAYYSQMDVTIEQNGDQRVDFIE